MVHVNGSALARMFSLCSTPFMRKRYETWYDPATEPSPFLAALAHTRHMCTRAEMTVPHATEPGSHIFVHAIMSAIDDYAERETGHREYFWTRPHSAGGR